MTRCYNSVLRAADEEYLAQLKLQLTALQTAILAVSAETMESYRFDDGAGSQQAKQRDVSKMRIELMSLKSEIDHYERKLGCGLNVNLRLRRRAYRGYYR